MMCKRRERGSENKDLDTDIPVILQFIETKTCAMYYNISWPMVHPWICMHLPFQSVVQNIIQTIISMLGKKRTVIRMDSHHC